MPRPLDQQTIVITGASSGFGPEAAIRFGRRGAKVVLAALVRGATRPRRGPIEWLGSAVHDAADRLG